MPVNLCNMVNNFVLATQEGEAAIVLWPYVEYSTYYTQSTYYLRTEYVWKLLNFRQSPYTVLYV